MVLHTPSPAFRGLANEADLGLVLKPLLRAYLFEARFPGEFSVTFHNHDLDFGPDGYFHPSTHPLMPERMLYYYLKHPEQMVERQFDYMGTLSVTIGNAMHGFIQMCLQDQGVLLGPEDFERDNIRWNPSTGEPTVIDEACGSRGSMDGILRCHVPTHPHLERQVFEFKTRTAKAKMLKDLDLETYKEKHPDYYAANQDYMRMSGFGMVIVLFMALGYPWEMSEIHVPYDPAFALGVRDKYLRVRAAVNNPEGDPPMPCCSPKSKDAKACPARAVCPIGLQ
jgi:hypothetical protein